MTPPPPVGEYSIVTFLSAVEIQRGQQQPRLALVNLRQVCWIVKDKVFYGTERYVVEVEVMEIATVEKYMTDDVCLTQACIQERVSSTHDKLEGQIIHCVRSL